MHGVAIKLDCKDKLAHVGSKTHKTGSVTALATSIRGKVNTQHAQACVQTVVTNPYQSALVCLLSSFGKSALGQSSSLWFQRGVVVLVCSADRGYPVWVFQQGLQMQPRGAAVVSVCHRSFGPKGTDTAVVGSTKAWESCAFGSLAPSMLNKVDAVFLPWMQDRQKRFSMYRHRP